MSDKRRYLHYSVVQYVHARREERINVGVAVFDPLERKLVPAFDPETAADRIRCLYADADAIGIQHYLAGLVRSLPRDERVQRAFESDESPLEALVLTKRNMLQLSPIRLYGAVSAKDAAQQLLRKFVSPPEASSEEREKVGVRRAREVTAAAIASVTGKIAGINYSSEDWIYGGGRFKYRIRFPFYLPENGAAIDAISLAGSGVKGSEAEADHFIKKVSNLRKVTDDVTPYATAAVDSKDPQMGWDLIRYIRDELGWEETRIVEADLDAATRMVRQITSKVAA